nr:hypothetical protein [Tanacetum cinerariifolium]
TVVVKLCLAVVLRRCCSGGCVGFLELRVLVTCRSRLGRQMELLGDETKIVPLYYHIVDNFQIQFEREKFCLITGLKFGVEYWADYNNEDDPIPFSFLLGLEDRRGVPDWILRDANIKRWPSLYGTEPKKDADHKLYSMFGFTWAFKRRLPIERLIPDEIEARSDWWVSSRAYFDGRISEGGSSSFPTANNSFFEGAQATPSYGHNMAMPNWKTPMPSHPGTFNWQSQMPSHSATPNWQPLIPSHPGTSNWQSQMSSHLATPNWQTPIPSHPHDAGLFNSNILNQERREVRPSMYRRTPYIDLPPTTVLPKKRGDKTKNKSKNANVSPLNLENAFVDDNVGEDEVMIMAECETGNYFVHGNVDPSKHMNAWIELLIKERQQNANWIVSKSGTEDRGLQLAIMNLGHQFDNACTAKDDLQKAYEECKDIPMEQRALIENLLKIESEFDYAMQNALFRKVAILEKQTIDKNHWLQQL